MGSASCPDRTGQDRREGEGRTVAFQVNWKGRADLAGQQRIAVVDSALQRTKMS